MKKKITKAIALILAALALTSCGTWYLYYDGDVAYKLEFHYQTK